ncbi:hypothetical protein [Tunicatimonas pelagia]|uniref:hypothetical protein n=1 Tax=Tunicatimonas pelagia TaxID=931531 RepID=UPI002665DE41|nr:hypothetical protein [Tunicatimonas pelagia]WKN45549.1 hypothetical protein P0M28_11340 [Tunicatimonas pelagia]
MSRRVNKLRSVAQFIERLLPSGQGSLKVVILCVIAATTFWFFSALNKDNYTTRIRYPLAITYPSDSNTYLLSELPEDVTVQVTGGGWDLLKKSLRLNTTPLEVSLDTPTRTKYILGQSLAEGISGQLDNLDLDYVVTDTLRINIDSTQNRTVAVAVDPQSMQLAENYRMVSDMRVLPSQVEVWGPTSLVDNLPDTLQLSLNNREVSGKVEAILEVSLPDNRIEASPNEVVVRLATELYTKVERKTTVVPVNFPEDSSVYLAQNFVTVSFWLPDDLISPALNQLSFQSEADLETWNSEDSTVAVKLVNIPAIVSDISFKPSRIPVQYAP